MRTRYQILGLAVTLMACSESTTAIDPGAEAVCSGTLIVDGISKPTTALEFLVPVGGATIVEVGWVSDPIPDDGQSDGASFRFETPIQYGATGTVEGGGGGLIDPQGVFTTSPDSPPLAMTITTNDGQGGRVEGSVVGQVIAGWRNGDLVPLNFTFDIGYDPNQSWNDRTNEFRTCLVGG